MVGGGLMSYGPNYNEMFKTAAKIDLLHVPYKGGVPATAAMIAGESDMGFVCISAAVPHIKAGRLILLGVTTARRSPDSWSRRWRTNPSARSTT